VDSFIYDVFRKTSVGEIKAADRLALMPLFGPAGGPRYLTLTEAKSDGCIAVTEISESGSVPNLRVENKADLPVLLLDGEELAGAKQNRVVNTTILLKKASVTIIPVSCTEAGRWSYVAPDFADSGVVMSHRLRAAKAEGVSESLARGGRFDSDQRRVWDEVERLHKRAGVHSPTSAMRDVFEARREALDNLVDAFVPLPNQTGLLAFIDGRVVALDLLSQPSAYAAVAAKLVRSYAMEAVVGKPTGANKPSKKAAQTFLHKAGEIAGGRFKSIGHGHDYRFGGKDLTGTALVYRKRVIHAAFFATTGPDQSNDMMPPQWRSGHDPVVY